MLVRKVIMDGKEVNAHILSSITHSIGERTTLIIVSYEDASSADLSNPGVITSKIDVTPCDTHIDYDRAYEIIANDPQFEEYHDPRNDIIESLAGDLSDEQAAQVPWAYPVWAVDTRYEIGDRVTYKDVLYKCLQGHTSQSIWTPINAVSLWADLTGHGEGSDVPDWVQPGSTNPYNKGDRVRFEEQIYESVMDGNVWSPRDYPGGWKLVS